MGFRFRKSINTGLGFRVNLSKSGIGYSWGIKGVRITKTAKGTTRHTVSIPGTGISWVTETGKHTPNRFQTQTSQYLNTDLGEQKNTNIVNPLDYAPAEYTDFLNEIKRIQTWNSISTTLIFSTVLSILHPVFILSGLFGLLLKMYVHFKMPISIQYQFDDETLQSYNALQNMWMRLNDCKKLWQITTETSVNNGKRNAGVKRILSRIETKAINKAPYFLKMDIHPFGLQLQKKQLLFLPDKLLIIDGKKVGSLNYDDVRMGIGKTRFVERGSIPKDASIVDTTWQKVNKNGSPDKRFKDNAKLPICEYGQIMIASNNTLRVEIMFSDSSIVDDLFELSRIAFRKYIS